MKTDLAQKIIKQVDDETGRRFLQYFVGDTIQRNVKENDYKIKNDKEDNCLYITFINLNYVDYLDELTKVAYDDHIENITESEITHCFYYESKMNCAEIIDAFNDIRDPKCKQNKKA